MDSSSCYRLLWVILVLYNSLVDHAFGITVSGEGNQTIQIETGEDAFLPCEARLRFRIYNWMKDGVAVQADDAFISNRLFIIPREGLLLLNVEETDGGVFVCQVLNRDYRFIETFITLEVVRKEDENEFKCGKKRMINGRIIGGKEVLQAGSYPWMALILYVEGNISKPICGGTLVNNNFVITTATCARGYFQNMMIVRLGEYIISQTESYEKTFRVAESIMHPEFDQVSFDSDIALLRLEEPVTYSDNILPLCIPSELLGEQLLASHRYGVVTGWGREDLNENAPDFSDELNKAKLDIVDQEVCKDSHSHEVTTNMFCALGGSQRSGIRDACEGDSGSPFLIKEGHISYLVGISSWGIGCADPQYPGVYTRVSRFSSWILEVTAAFETCPGQLAVTKQSLDQKQSTIDELEIRVRDLVLQFDNQATDLMQTLDEWDELEVRDWENQLENQDITEDAWSEYQFNYDNNWNSCHGTTYVRKRPVASDAFGQYLGAVLCTNERYKLFLADDLNSEFKNIADGSGHGQDHCEFVGAARNVDFALGEWAYAPSAQGYVRSSWGTAISKHAIGQGTAYFYTKWYECGISIP